MEMSYALEKVFKRLPKDVQEHLTHEVDDEGYRLVLLEDGKTIVVVDQHDDRDDP